MRSTRRSLIWSTVALLVFSLVMPAIASANVDVFETDWVSSDTNPGDIDDYPTSWREGWGNDPLASFFVKVPQPDIGQTPIYSSYYVVQRVDRVDTMTPFAWNPAAGASYFRADTGPTTWHLYLDVPGLVSSPGPHLGTVAPPTGATRAYEGLYQVDVQTIAREHLAARGGFFFGVDVTPPAKVTHVAVRDSVGEPPVSGWLKQSRAHITWDDVVYDALSGTGYFAVYLDGKPFAPKGFPEVRLYDNREHYPTAGTSFVTPRAITIENLPAGKHTLQVMAVDRAQNKGPLSDPVQIAVDPDLPEITMVWPKLNGQTVGAYSTFKANVTDQGGVAKVKFYIDGVLKYTDTAAPYEYPASLGGYAQSSSHTLRVLAEDVVGRTNYVDSTFVLDKYAPSVTGISCASLFYPIIREGYKDNLGVSFTSSEPGTAKLVVRNSSGSVVRTVSKSVIKGSNSITWNGSWNNGGPRTGVYKVSVSVTDNAGNVGTSSSRSVTIRNYELVRVDADTVRVIAR